MGLGPGADLAGRGSVGRGSPQDRGSVQVGGSRNMRTLIEVYKNAKPSRRVVPPSRECDCARNSQYYYAPYYVEQYEFEYQQSPHAALSLSRTRASPSQRTTTSNEL